MKKRILSVLLLLAMLATLLAGCANEPTEVKGSHALTPTGELTTPPLVASFTAATQKASDDFSVSLLQHTMTDKNTLVSPLSVMAALALAANGAGGNTLAQIEQSVGMPLADLNAMLQAYTNPADSDDALHMANSIWVRNDFRDSIQPDFLDRNTQWLKSELFTADFDAQTVEDINQWVSDRTNGKIPHILDEIDSRETLILANALHFAADWERPFLHEATYDEEFTLADGSKQTVPMMHSQNSEVYLQDEHSVGVMRYYEGRRYAFVALLPEAGMSLTDYVATLNGGHLQQLLQSGEEKEVVLTMPKFETDFSCELKSALQSMGIVDAFVPEAADFTGIGGEKGDWSIGRVLHKTFLRVDEKGSEAAAATVAIFESAAMPPEEDPPAVCLNRPFVYMLVDCEQSLPMFIGTLNSVNE